MVSSDMENDQRAEKNNAGIFVHPEANSSIQDGVQYRRTNTYYALYGTHNLVKGNWDVAAGTSGWSDGYIYLQYE